MPKPKSSALSAVVMVVFERSKTRLGDSARVASFLKVRKLCPFLLFVSFQLLGLSIGNYSLLVWWFFP